MHSAQQGASATFQDSSVPENQRPTSLNLSTLPPHLVPFYIFAQFSTNMIKFLRERDFHVLCLCAHTFFSNFQNHNKFVRVFFVVFSFFKVKFCWQISPKISELTTDNRIIFKNSFCKTQHLQDLKQGKPARWACMSDASEPGAGPLTITSGEQKWWYFTSHCSPCCHSLSEWGWSYLWTSKHWAVGKGDCRPLYPEENCSLTGLLNWAFVRKGSPCLSSPTL